MSKIILYRVRRPDGTVIESRYSELDGVHSAAVFDGCLLGTIWGSIDPVGAALAAGYTIEPVEFAPVPSESTLAFTLSALETLRSEAGDGERVHFDAALAELRAAWGGGE